MKRGGGLAHRVGTHTTLSCRRAGRHDSGPCSRPHGSHYPWTRTVFTGHIHRRQKRRPWTWDVDMGVQNDARVDGWVDGPSTLPWIAYG